MSDTFLVKISVTLWSSSAWPYNPWRLNTQWVTQSSCLRCTCHLYCKHRTSAAATAAISDVIDPTADPSCPRCNLPSHTLEHWLQECPATASKRFQILGEADPPLSILVTNQQEVMLFARETLPWHGVVALSTSSSSSGSTDCRCSNVLSCNNASSKACWPTMWKSWL